jgi:hypothetical protein
VQNFPGYTMDFGLYAPLIAFLDQLQSLTDALLSLVRFPELSVSER